MKEYIIIGGDNLNTLGIVRSLGEVRINPIIVLFREGHIKLVTHSKYARRIFWVNSIEEGVTLMYNYTSEGCRPFVYTTDDNTESYFDLHYDELIPHFFFYNAGEAGRITHLMDKKVICDLAEECGFNVPKSEVVSRGELPKNIKYPVITKTLNPYSPGWKRDVGIYYNDEELAKAYKGMISENLCLQEWIDKKNEIALQCISINGGEYVLITYYAELLRYTNTSFGGLKRYCILSNDELRDRIKTIIKRIHYSGVFEIEFLVSQDDRLLFLEINFRSSAANYAMMYGNINLPYLWSEMTLSNKSRDLLLRDESFISLNENLDFSQFVATHEIPFFKWLKDLFGADCYYLFNKRDPYPFFFFLFQKVMRKFNKKCRFTRN